jgi:stage V sporulation protein B
VFYLRDENETSDDPDMNEKQSIRKQYWDYALTSIHEAHGEGSFSNVTTSKQSWIGGFFGISGFLLLFFGAKIIATQWLSYPDAEIPLKILSFGLPFLSTSNALQGFFLSLRKATYSTVLQVTEDLSKMGATVLLFSLYLNKGPNAALCAMVAGMAIGETVSCIVGYLLYRKKTRRSLVSEPCKPGIFREIVKIALPCAFSGYLRSGIGMIEGILVPKGLQSF